MPTWVLAELRSPTGENHGDCGEFPKQAERDRGVGSHTGNKQSNVSGHMAYKKFNLVLVNIDGFYMYANDILLVRIDKRSLPEFMNTPIGDSVDTPTAIICFNETKEGSTFPFPPQYALHHSPRNLRDFDPQQGGGAAILVHDSLDVFHPVRLTAGVPPEIVAVKV